MLDNSPTRIKRLRNRAEEIRARAEAMHVPAARATMFHLARSYERWADFLEGQNDQGGLTQSR